MKRYLHAVITGLLVFVSASVSGAQQPSRLERDIASTLLPARPAADSTQGAAAAEGGCPVGELPDCNGNCVPLTWLGDGICDKGAVPFGGNDIFLNCSALGCDGGDCTPEECTSSVCGNGVIEAGETCDDGNTTPGDGCSPTCQIEGGPSTYSVRHLVGEIDPVSGLINCFRTTDIAFPGEPDDIVTFDGLSEALATDLLGTVAVVTETETSNPSGTTAISVQTGSPMGTDLFPGGLVSPNTGTVLTAICWFIGTDDPLDLTPMPTVSSATISFTQAGATILGPFDVPLAFFSDPWDGLLKIGLTDAAGLFVNGVQLDLVFAPGTCGNATCDVGETCANCPADCDVCPGSCPGKGECCVANGTIGCEDTSCCEAVCADDPFCCGNDPVDGGVWDDICADAAMTLCPGVSSCPIACPGTGECCEVHPELGCSDSACCSTVCDADPFCCTTSWDEVCVEEAAILCGTCATGACCWDSGCETPGTCEAPVLCAGGCQCFELAAGGGGCTAFIDGCAATAPCPNGSQDCPTGQQCYINTCCGGPVCYPDCAVGGAAASVVEGVTTQGSRATRVRAGAAARGSVLTCTDSTDVYCTAFGGLYNGDATLCSDVDVCADTCGDGVLDFGEVCDDGGTDACAPCNADCTSFVVPGLNEYKSFFDCLDGPVSGALDPVCDCFDTDADGDVDLRDFAAFQRDFNGPP